MLIKTSIYKGSFIKLADCPKSDLPEYAFIGRSNVGKSTLINMLCGRKELAKVSKTPGKTQTINFFEINGTWNMIDLPGYGYAKVAKTKRAGWSAMTEQFLKKRDSLVCTFVLVDSNVPLQQIDVDFMIWLAQQSLMFGIIFTKADKLRPTQVESTIEKLKEGLLTHFETLPATFVTSGVKRSGKDDLLAYIDTLNTLYNEHNGAKK